MWIYSHTAERTVQQDFVIVDINTIESDSVGRERYYHHDVLYDHVTVEDVEPTLCHQGKK